MGVVIFGGALLVAVNAAQGPAGSAADGGEGGGPTTDVPVCPVGALDERFEDDPDADPVEITVWHSYVALTQQTMDQIAADYNESQDRVHVNVESQGVGYTELQAAYERAIPANDLPAIAVMEDTQTQNLVDLGTVMPAASCAEVDGYEGFEEFLPIARDYYSVPIQVDGETDTLQLPGSVNLATALLYYNRDHFQDAGLDPDAPPQTLEELADAARALKAAGVTDRPFAWNMQPWMIEFWLTGAGAPIVDNDNGRALEAADASAFDNETTHRLFEFFEQMLDEELLTPYPGRDAQIDHYLAMALGGASMTIDTSTAVTTINSVLEGTADPSDFGLDLEALPEIDINLDASALPGLDEPGVGQVGGGVWYLSNTVPPEEIAAAWDFLKYVNLPEQQELWHTRGGYLPSQSDVADSPVIQEFWADTRPGRWLSRAYGLAENLDPEFPGPLIGPYRQVRNAVNDALQSMMLAGASPDDAIAEADAAITAALVRYNDIRFG
jgi:sn-glycerol 3-phosphate transport system substrate-binding protein